MSDNMIGNFPDHPFEGMVDSDPDDPDVPCHAIFHVDHDDGSSMDTQCGHVLAEHPQGRRQR